MKMMAMVGGGLLVGFSALPMAITSTRDFPVLTAAHMLLVGAITKLTLSTSGGKAIDERSFLTKGLKSLVITSSRYSLAP
jgi:hypothetical protein